MFEYFHGWRRKTAMLALVMACLLAALMVRSLSWSDSIYAENVHLETFRGRVFVKVFFTRFQYRLSYQSRDNRQIVDAYADPQIQSLWKWRRWGFAYEFEDSVVKFMFPIWSVAIPLGMLSAWLLCSKHRRQGCLKRLSKQCRPSKAHEVTTSENGCTIEGPISKA